MTDRQMIAAVERIQRDQAARGIKSMDNLPAWHTLLEQLNRRQRILFRDTLADVLASMQAKARA